MKIATYVEITILILPRFCEDNSHHPGNSRTQDTDDDKGEKYLMIGNKRSDDKGGKKNFGKIKKHVRHFFPLPGM